VLACIIVVFGGAYSLARSLQPCLWCGYHQCTGGNEACGILTESSIVKTTRSGSRETISETHLRVGKGLEAIHRVTRSGALPFRGDSTRTRGKRELHDTSVKILVIDRSLHLYLN
jgi:hypothetical protein